MSNLFGTGELSKMRFTFYEDAEMQKPHSRVPEKVVMYNPSDIQIGYANAFDPAPKVSQGVTDQKFSSRMARTLTLTLKFDGTGASPSPRSSLIRTLGTSLSDLTSKAASEKVNIHKQVKDFLDAGYKVDNETHVPTYIMITWGSLHFAGVITSASTKYSLFRPDGTPLRAELTITLTEHINNKKYNAELKLLSPDLTRSYIIKEGDRLDALCDKFYNDPSLYLQVARANNLKNKRKLIPGQVLTFPPIEKRN